MIKFREDDYISGGTVMATEKISGLKINNIPRYAYDCKYIVARVVDGEAWFWGAYDDTAKAYQAANEINGKVVTWD